MLKKARQLRAEWSDSGIRFFTFLLGWEQYEASWKGNTRAGTGYSTFEELVHVNNIVEYHRIAKFKEAVSRLGSIEAVRAIGVEEGLDWLLRIPVDAPSRQNPGVKAVTMVGKLAMEGLKRNKVPFSGRSIRGLVEKSWDSPPPPPKEEKRDARVQELLATIFRLRKKCRSADIEIRWMNKRIEQLERQLAKEKARAAKRD